MLTAASTALGPSPPDTDSRSALLCAPEAVHHHVLSWCPDSLTANALMSSCTSLGQLRHSPAAAALLLTRCPAQNHDSALAACSTCKGGASAVSHHVLQLLQAGPASGGPFHAPEGLLQAMLDSASGGGDAGLVRDLLALPQPPDVDASAGRALRTALLGGADHSCVSPSLSTMQALLHGGADPCVDGLSLFGLAAQGAGRLPAFTRLLEACPQDAKMDAMMVAVASAFQHNNADLLPHLAAGLAVPRFLRCPKDILQAAAMAGRLLVLRLLLGLRTWAAHSLGLCLCSAAACGHFLCVELLLDHGADARFLSSAPLLFAAMPVAGNIATEVDRRSAVQLLIGRGASVAEAQASANDVGEPGWATDLEALLGM